MSAYITPDGTIVQTGGSALVPTAQDFAGGIGSANLSLPGLAPLESDLATGASVFLDQRYAQDLGLLPGAGNPSRNVASGGRIPWVLIGGLGVVWIAMKSKAR